MKKCPLCGKEYEEGSMCPSCNVLLIDMASGKAVGEEKKLRKTRASRETVKTEKVRDNISPVNIQVSPGVIIGLIVFLVIVVVLVFWLMNRGQTKEYDMMQKENLYNNTYPEEGEDTGEETLNEADFLNSQLIENGTDEYIFELPAYWQELCISEMDDDALYYYQNRSRASEAGGYLFSIQKMSAEYYSPDYLWLAESDGDVYALVMPKIPAYDTADPYAKLEYERLLEDVGYVNSSFMLVNHQGESEYIFAQSSSEYLSRSDLEGLTKQELSYARNEIYARKGRRFQDESLQSYFNSKEWYSGTIAPEDFTESMLNKYEKANTELILEYEKDKGYR